MVRRTYYIDNFSENGKYNVHTLPYNRAAQRKGIHAANPKRFEIKTLFLCHWIWL